MEKTILSDLEEEACGTENKEFVNDNFTKGNSDKMEDSAIFKSFFASEKTELQAGVHEDSKPTVRPGNENDVHKPQTPVALSHSSSNISNSSESVKETVTMNLLDKKGSNCVLSELPEFEIKLPTLKSNENCNGNIDNYHSNLGGKFSKSDNTTEARKSVVNDDNKGLELTNCDISDDIDAPNCNILDVAERTLSNDQSELICSVSEHEDAKNILSQVNTGFINSDGQGLLHDIPRQSSSTKASVELEQNVADSNNFYCEKENSCDVVKSVMIEDAGKESVDLTTKERYSDLSSHETLDGKPILETVKNSNSGVFPSKQVDPFTLSGDEDFSPKVYKPIKRKLNQGLAAVKTHQMDLCDDLSVMVEKKQKLAEENGLSLTEIGGRKSVPVSYVYSKELVEKSNKLIRIEGRANLVHSLIEVYGILQHVDVIPPRLATEREILGFHCSTYIDFLRKMTDCDDLSDSISAEAEAYGLSYDCPVQEDVYETATLISGATITAAESLINGTASIAINWCGGWHHAKRDCASGFCYINDIVLGILKLREKYDRVLYVDLDLHHGDGVEEAFYMTPKVMTVSFHKYACGFFPGSGSVDDIGSGRGKMFSINVPLQDGIGDSQFFSLFTSVMKKVREKFNGEALVIQCGADTLSEDPMASFNLTHVAIARCVCFLLTWNLPTLLLGGGGYNFPNTAKCWTFLTAMAAGKKLPVDIPEHEHLMEYGPSYELMTSQGNRKDCNTKEHFYGIMAKICKNLNSL